MRKEVGTACCAASAKWKTWTNIPSLLTLRPVFGFLTKARAPRPSKSVELADIKSYSVGIFTFSLSVLFVKKKASEEKGQWGLSVSR